MDRTGPSVVRVTDKTVTECLARAMENADRMKNVVVLYETHDGDPNPGGFYSTEGTSIAILNYLLDLAKHWIFNS